jgi:Fe-S-cluster containining protein
MDSENDRENVCRRCGNCCHLDMAAYVCLEDIERWEREGRDDIIAHVRENGVTSRGDRVHNGFGSGIKTCLMSCVYLGWNGSSATCGIYETRTKVCRDFVPGSSYICPLHRQKPG